MKKILVPVDFSPHTENSCRFAINLAAQLQYDILLFHSFFENIYFSDGGFVTGFESGIMLSDNIIKDYYDQRRSSLEDLTVKLSAGLKERGIEGIAITYLLESGDPEVQILNIIDKHRPELIIMGSSGMGRKSLFSGSVARRIMEKTEVPVIAIPDAEPSPVIRNVAYMTNFDPGDKHAILELESILAPLKVNIHCIHLQVEKDSQGVHGELANLSTLVESHGLKGRIFIESYEADDMHDTLHTIIDSRQIDLIAFIPHKRNIFQNIVYQGLTKEDLFQTLKPVMAIQPRIHS